MCEKAAKGNLGGFFVSGDWARSGLFKLCDDVHKVSSL